MPLEVRMGRLEGAYEQISKRLDSIDARLDRFDAKLDGIDGRFDALRSEMITQFRWITGMIIGTWITTILAIFFHRGSL